LERKVVFLTPASNRLKASAPSIISVRGFINLTISQIGHSWVHDIFGRLVALTKGFRGGRQLIEHYGKHAIELAIATVMQYEQRADAFLGSTKKPHVLECKRTGGDTVRFDPLTDEYGVLASNGIIRTYFKAIPCCSIDVKIRQAIKDAGCCHAYANNIDYFNFECSRY